jgi:hypothetical protein
MCRIFVLLCFVWLRGRDSANAANVKRDFSVRSVSWTLWKFGMILCKKKKCLCVYVCV